MNKKIGSNIKFKHQCNLEKHAFYDLDDPITQDVKSPTVNGETNRVRQLVYYGRRTPSGVSFITEDLAQRSALSTEG